MKARRLLLGGLSALTALSIVVPLVLMLRAERWRPPSEADVDAEHLRRRPSKLKGAQSSSLRSPPGREGKKLETGKGKAERGVGSVSCGNHRAPTCAECGDEEYCNGDCEWEETSADVDSDEDDDEGGGTCRSKSAEKTKNTKIKNAPIVAAGAQASETDWVSCGNHQAPTCAKCGDKEYCNGDCEWEGTLDDVGVVNGSSDSDDNNDANKGRGTCQLAATAAEDRKSQMTAAEEEAPRGAQNQEKLAKQEETPAKTQQDNAPTKPPPAGDSTTKSIDGDDDFWAKCAAYTPQCESPEVIRTKWSYAKDDYDQKSCCIKHGKLRGAVVEVWDALKHFNLTAWIDHGSALGIARHGGTMIPWDYDADIAVLMDTEDFPGMQLYPGQRRHLIIRNVSHAKDWLDGFVCYMNTKRTGDPGDRISKWGYKVVHAKDSCIQLQLRVKGAHVDLFGMRDMRRNSRGFSLVPKMIDGEWRPAVNYFGCFQVEHNGNEHSYYTFPPVPCQFYDKQVMCPRDNVQYLKHYYGNNVMTKGVSHGGFYDKRYIPGGGDGI